jgi:radical SAM superfamily enzyme YgiQ (UPF0313 family)
MKLCLISAATATDFEDAADARSQVVQDNSQAPNLGVLTLAAILERIGSPPALVNLNRRYYEYLGEGYSGVGDFAEWAAEVILSTSAEVFGFSSICSSYPLSIRIARCVKHARPDSTIIFGGPQATVVDRATLSAFPFIDYILRGEAEETLPHLLAELEGGRRFSSVLGLTWRSPFGVARNGNAQVIQDLDALPLPAFHLTDELVGLKVAPLEVGRGCPFACAFCSTNDFFRRKFRLKSPERMLADMRAVASRYGIRAFELTHDMFTVDRRKVVDFCEHLRSSGEGFTWSCSARTDCVDGELLELMVKGGCRSIFFGIESGSQRLQRVIEKDLDVEQARQVVSMAEGLGVGTTVSLISGFPDETWEDVRDTVGMFVHSLGHQGSKPQFNVLAPLADTPVHLKYRDRLTLDELCSDMCHQGRHQNALDRELIRQYPEIFPNFYLVPVPYLDRDYILELREFLLLAPERLRWLMVALHRSAGGLLEFFSAWRENRMRRRPGLRGWELRYYYMRDEARLEFVRFVLQHFSSAISPFAEYLGRFHLALAEARTNAPDGPRGDLSLSPSGSDVIWRAAHVVVVRFEADVQGIVNRLRSGEASGEVDRSMRHFRTQNSEENAAVIETPRLIAAGLEACDGRTTVDEFVDRLAKVFDGPAPDCRLAAECLLETLRGKGLVEIRTPTPYGGALVAESLATADIPMLSSAGSYSPAVS